MKQLEKLQKSKSETKLPKITIIENEGVNLKKTLKEAPVGNLKTTTECSPKVTPGSSPSSMFSISSEDEEDFLLRIEDAQKQENEKKQEPLSTLHAKKVYSAPSTLKQTVWGQTTKDFPVIKVPSNETNIENGLKK